MIKADLHMHTTASDGGFSPSDVVHKAHAAGVTHLAITDHDTMGGLKEARLAARALDVVMIDGVEISAGGESEVHVLGYGIDENCEELQALFAKMHDERIARARKIAQKLDALAVGIDIERILREAGDSVGRPHIARALVECGHVSSMQDAFIKYLAEGRSAYVPREKLEVEAMIALFLRNHAVPVLAHPALLNMPQTQFLPLLDAWVSAGLMGMEVYHPSQANEYDKWLRIARARGLLITGGSDFHDHNPRHGMPGETADAWVSCAKDVDLLLKRMQG